MVLSENIPVAVNCCVVLGAMVGLVGVTAMDTSAAGLTVRKEVPDTVPEVAVIVVEPVFTEDALPLEPAALLMVATDVLDELQVTAAVRS